MLTYATTTAPGCSRFHARSDSASIVAAGSEIGKEHGLRGRQDRGGLGHEVNAAKDDHLGLGPRRLARQPERIPDEIGDVLDLRALVVVRENDRVAVLRERLDLPLQRGDDLVAILDSTDVHAGKAKGAGSSGKLAGPCAWFLPGPDSLCAQFSGAESFQTPNRNGEARRIEQLGSSLSARSRHWPAVRMHARSVGTRLRALAPRRWPRPRIVLPRSESRMISGIG